jgi:hypothetical protein
MNTSTWGLRGPFEGYAARDSGVGDGSANPPFNARWMEKLKADPRLDHRVYLELSKHLCYATSPSEALPRQT